MQQPEGAMWSGEAILPPQGPNQGPGNPMAPAQDQPDNPLEKKEKFLQLYNSYLLPLSPFSS